MLSLSYQSFVKLGIVIWYEYNKSYISKNLCENRARPEKKCCGKCYLRKQLNKVEKGGKEHSAIPDKWNLGEVAVFMLPQVISVPFMPACYNERIPLFNVTYKPTGLPLRVFHPPSVC
jgi:hypothetical protein